MYYDIKTVYSNCNKKQKYFKLYTVINISLIKLSFLAEIPLFIPSRYVEDLFIYDCIELVDVT